MQTGRGIRNAGSALALGLAHYTKTSGQVTGAATVGIAGWRGRGAERVGGWPSALSGLHPWPAFCETVTGGLGPRLPPPPSLKLVYSQPAATPDAGSVWLWRPLGVRQLARLVRRRAVRAEPRAARPGPALVCSFASSATWWCHRESVSGWTDNAAKGVLGRTDLSLRKTRFSGHPGKGHLGVPRKPPRLRSRRGGEARFRRELPMNIC